MTAKEERQAASARMTKCTDCGQTARNGCELCGSCQTEQDNEDNLLRELDYCDTISDLKQFIREHLLK